MENINDNSVSETRIMYTKEHVDMIHKTLSELQQKYAEVVKQSEFRAEDSTRWRERYETERRNRIQILSLAHNLFEEMIENDDEALDNYSEKYERFVGFGMEGFSRQVEFSLSYVVTVSGTATIPYGSDFSEYDSSFMELNIDEDQFSGQLMDDCEHICMDIEIDERDRDRSWEVTN